MLSEAKHLGPWLYALGPTRNLRFFASLRTTTDKD